MGDNHTSSDTLDEVKDAAPDVAEAEAAQQDTDQDVAVEADQQESSDEQIESLQEQLQEAKDQALRAAAEMQNLRKRAERDVENAHKFGQEKLISSLLPVLDSLDRAIDSVSQGSDAEQEAAPSEALKSILEGVELTRKSALDALKRFSVEVVEPYGEPFDPQLHEAVTTVPSDTAEPNSVVDVLQKGYSLNGRLLRAAMVVVAKA